MRITEMQDGEKYWVTFTDGSRVLVEVTDDKYGDVDIRNELLDILLHVGARDPRGGIALNVNAGDIVKVEDRGLAAWIKRVNADPEFNAGFDLLANMLGDPLELSSDPGPGAPSYGEPHTLERDCE